MRLLTYTLWRLLILAVAAGVLYLLGLRSWLLAIAAIAVAAAGSYLFLKAPRDAAAEELAARSQRRSEPAHDGADELAEDAALDEPAGGPSEQEAEAEQDAVAELEQPGVPQDDDEVAAGGPAADAPHEHEGPGNGRQG